MNDDSVSLSVSFDESADEPFCSEAEIEASNTSSIPGYLQDTYWWAYLHPKAVRFWEREWLVNTILWGQMGRLTGSVISELDLVPNSNVLQIACVYGAFSGHLCKHASKRDSKLHVLDIAPIQIANARRKLSGYKNVSYHLQDSSDMRFSDEAFEHSILYFLLHEQPESVRRRTLSEALRVIKPGGKVVIVDYHRPHWWNGLRAVMWPVLRTLEPFALDLWHDSVTSWLPPGKWESRTQLFCGGLYQKTIVRKHK